MAKAPSAYTKRDRVEQNDPPEIFFFFGILGPQILWEGRKQKTAFWLFQVFLAQLPKNSHFFFFNRKERKIKKVEAKTQRIDLRTTEKFSQAVEQSSNHETDHMRLAGFQNCYRLVTPVCLLLHSF